MLVYMRTTPAPSRSIFLVVAPVLVQSALLTAADAQPDTSCSYGLLVDLWIMGLDMHKASSILLRIKR